MEQLFEIVRFVAESAWRILPVFLISVPLGVLVRALKQSPSLLLVLAHPARVVMWLKIST